MIFQYIIPYEAEIDIPAFWNMCLEYNTDELSETEYLDVVLDDLIFYVNSYIHKCLDAELNEYSLLELSDELSYYVLNKLKE